MEKKIIWPTCRFLFLLLGFCLIALSSANAKYVIKSYCLGNAWESCFTYVEGTFEPAMVQELAKELKTSEGATVYFNSEGGDLQTGMDVGRVIREAKRHTSIGSLNEIGFDSLGRPVDFPKGGKCLSACAYAFLGGVERIFQDPSILGVHRFYSVKGGLGGDEAQWVSGLVVEYIVQMGIDARVFVSATKAGAYEMYPISISEARQHSVISARGYGDLFLEPYFKGVIAAARRLDSITPYDLVDQVTFFCRRGQPNVLLHAHSSWLNKAEIPNARYGDGDSEDISSENISIKVNDEESWISIKIPSIHIHGFMKMIHSGFFYLDVPFPRVAGGVHGARLSLSAMDKAMIKSSFSHCIE